METEFKVQIGEFNGPLELLLEMIERRKLHVSDVSLSQVADEFIAHAKTYEDNEEEFPLSDSADFVLIASTLLLIKSKALLPGLELTEEEEQSIEDLEKRLALYKLFRDISSELKVKYGKNRLHFANERRFRKVSFAPSQDLSLESLLEAVMYTLDRVPKGEKLQEVMVQKVISLEEMIDSLSKRIQEGIQTSFRDFSGYGKAEKVDVIVSFLAMLELVRHGALRVSQSADFGDIIMESDDVGVPKY